MAIIVNRNSEPLKQAPKFFAGESDFEQYMNSDFCYVDKTRFLKYWWDSGDKISLIVRPRRFSKTMILSMVDAWFNSNNIKFPFLGTEILTMDYKALEHAREQVKTIRITLKDISARSFDQLYMGMFYAINPIYSRYQNEYDDFKERTPQPALPESNYKMHLQFLLKEFVAFLRYLNKETGFKFVVLIDEYDKILLDASQTNEHSTGYFDEVLTIYRDFLNTLLKDTPFVERAILTGVLPLAANSVFSAFNNSVRDTFFSRKYEDIFCFTEEEVKVLIGWMDEATRERLYDLYEGYLSGDMIVYNPWSIANFINAVVARDKVLTNSWINTGSTDWIAYQGTLTAEEQGTVSKLLQGDLINAPLNNELNYLDSTRSLSNFLTYAFYTGYLTFSDVHGDSVSLNVPNKEVLQAWIKNIESLVGKINIPFNWAEVLEKLTQTAESEQQLETLLDQLLECASTFDVPAENSYHMWILGMLTTLSAHHQIKSNREAGRGRFDIAVTPNTSSKLRNYVFELKRSDREDRLENDVESAVQQVKDNKYYQFFDNTFDIVIIGIAAYKKKVKVKIEIHARKSLER